MINYQLLNDSIVYYENYGFQRIESPWMVSAAVSGITKPKEQIDYEVSYNNKKKVLVASGEQSFLYLYLKDYLPKGRYQTITPCFRNDTYDFLHKKCFMKNELIDTKNIDQYNLEKIINDSLNFFKGYLSNVDIIKTDIGYDILYNNIELGSYGIRYCEFLDWIYATGCSEPRLSSVIKIHKDANI